MERQRSHGVVRLRAGRAGIVDLAESGPLRLRFPRGPGPREGILVNTAGGIACGDVFEVSVTLEPQADFVLTTTAAEKIYRSDGPRSTILNRVALAEGARLAWLPQETILFDKAAVRRRFEADLAPDAELLIAEIVVFGRAAHGETITDGLFQDVWRIRRDGRLVYADARRLDGPIADRLARTAIGGGARALATILDFSPAAEARLDEVRAALDVTCPSGVEVGASAWNGHLAIRMLATEIGTLRTAVTRLLEAYRGQAMPRVWQS